MTAPTAGASVLPDSRDLASWLDAHGLAPGEPLQVEPLGGGASNLMFSLRRGGHRWVLRRPPRVAVARAADGLMREFRLLSALDATDVPHPRTVAVCRDPQVLGAVFYLMEHVDAVLPADPAVPFRPDQVGEAMVDALACLHRQDHRALGLADFGRPGFHERQVRRWTGLLEREQGRLLPGQGPVVAFLEQHRPTSSRSCLMHGDYHLRNVMVDRRPPCRVAAIVDWETATVGDPLLDLAVYTFLCAARPDRAGPRQDAVLERYAEQTGFDLPDLTYYQVLARFRHAALLEGIYQRSRRDESRPTATSIGEHAASYMAEAADLVPARG